MQKKHLLLWRAKCFSTRTLFVSGSYPRAAWRETACRAQSSILRTGNSILFTPLTTRSILKVIGSHSNIELRNVFLARNNLDFVAATVMPASLAVSFIEAFDR